MTSETMTHRRRADRLPFRGRPPAVLRTIAWHRWDDLVVDGFFHPGSPPDSALPARGVRIAIFALRIENRASARDIHISIYAMHDCVSVMLLAVVAIISISVCVWRAYVTDRTKFLLTLSLHIICIFRKEKRARRSPRALSCQLLYLFFESFYFSQQLTLMNRLCARGFEIDFSFGYLTLIDGILLLAFMDLDPWLCKDIMYSCHSLKIVHCYHYACISLVNFCPSLFGHSWNI